MEVRAAAASTGGARERRRSGEESLTRALIRICRCSLPRMTITPRRAVPGTRREVHEGGMQPGTHPKPPTRSHGAREDAVPRGGVRVRAGGRDAVRPPRGRLTRSFAARRGPSRPKLDFLPFQCAGCRRSFCLEHRLPEKHGCTAPQTSAADVRVVVCPICAKYAGPSPRARVRPDDGRAASHAVNAAPRPPGASACRPGRTRT